MGLFSRRIKAKQIKSYAEFDEALSTGKPVFVDFMKVPCQPCQVMDGIVNELADEFSDEAVVIKANLAYVPELFAKFKVKSTPTFVLITPQGTGVRQHFRQSGLVKKDQLVSQLAKATQPNKSSSSSP